MPRSKKLAPVVTDVLHDGFLLKVEVNPKPLNTTMEADLAASNLLVTPNLTPEFWLLRVAVSDTQAVVAFPKFGIIGVGFQHETDWNTNLPSTCGVTRIFRHIKVNKGDPAIPDDRCLAALRLLQGAVEQLKFVRR